MPRSVLWVLTLGLVLGCANAGSSQAQDGKAPPFTSLDPKNTRTTKSGLKIEDVKVGDGDEAKIGNILVLNYTGWLTDGKKFDSSLDRDRPFSVTLGAGKVIKGWEEGLLGMRIGGKRRLRIPPALAYGERGYGKEIPSGSTLVFEVDLLKIKPGVKIEELKVGQGPSIKSGDQIAVVYELRLLNGRVIESSKEKGPLPLVLGAGQVIPGWDAGLLGMKVGGERKLTIAPEMAYGADGKDTIPPNATLVFFVKLLAVKSN